MRSIVTLAAVASLDWFRSSDWDDAAEADFEARLRRARAHNKPQYIKIKALALLESGRIESAEELLHRVLDQYPDALDAAYCAERLGDHAQARGDALAAEDFYRRALALRPDLNATTGEVHIGLAETLIAQTRFEEAIEALEYQPVARLGLAHGLCRWNAALAEAALGLGEAQVAADAASRALELVEAPDQFARHPGVGRAVLTENQAARLRVIARGQPSAGKAVGRWFRHPR